MKKWISWLLLISFAFTSNAQKTYTLKFSPAPGSRYDFSMATETKLQQKIVDQEMEMKMNLGLNGQYSITEAGPNKKMTVTYDKVSVAMDVMGQHIVMSSDDENPDTTDVTNGMFKALKGLSFAVELAPDGKVVQVDAKEMMDKIGNSPAKQEALQTLLGAEGLKAIIEQSFGFYPKKPVKQGDTWTATIQLRQPYMIAANALYTLTKVEGNSAFLNIKGSINTGDDVAANKEDKTLELAGDIAGTTIVDLDTGIPYSANIVQTIRGNINVAGQKTPMDASVNIRMTFTKK